MARFKIILDRPSCIGAASCVIAAPDFWEMADDGKVRLKGAEQISEKEWVLEIDEARLKENIDAAQSCPVNVIHIINLETGEKLI